MVDKPGAGLKRGDVGTVVEVFESNEHHPGGCVVEFVDETGKVLALLDVDEPLRDCASQLETTRRLTHSAIIQVPTRTS